jgi:hypothetical protein
MSEELRHYEEARIVSVPPRELFEFVDDPLNLSSHMEKPRWQMLWGWMKNTPDEKGGKEVGSVMTIKGSVLGINISLVEKIIQREVPSKKAWQTFNGINLVVIGHYTMGFEIDPQEDNSNLKVYIDYELPKSAKTRWLGKLVGDMYAKWCVRQMLNDTYKHFISS